MRLDYSPRLSGVLPKVVPRYEKVARLSAQAPESLYTPVYEREHRA
jgi:hypothetical protein